jgi:hypothetical protein
MLRMFYDLGLAQFMSIVDAQRWDQRPFRSMLVQGWVAYRPGRGFHITKTGRAAYHEFLNTDIGRKDATLPLTAYFDAAAYGLKPSRPAKPVAESQPGA